MKYQQTFKGIPILDRTVGLVGSESGEILSYVASYVPDIKVGVTEKISADQAVTIARGTYTKEVAEITSIRKVEKIIVVKVGRQGGSDQATSRWVAH